MLLQKRKVTTITNKYITLICSFDLPGTFIIEIVLFMLHVSWNFSEEYSKFVFLIWVAWQVTVKNQLL